jgi:hypothetical protein
MKNTRICASLIAFAVIAGFAVPMHSATRQSPKAAKSKETSEPVTREVYGKIESIKGTTVSIRTRSGEALQVDAKPAQEAFRAAPLVVGRAIAVKGTVDKAGVLHAETIQRAKDSAAAWPADRP